MAALTISTDDEKRVKGMGFLNNKGTDSFSARVIRRIATKTKRNNIYKNIIALLNLLTVPRGTTYKSFTRLYNASTAR